MKYRIDLDAREELREARAYYNRQRSGLGKEFAAVVRQGIARVVAVPTGSSFTIPPFRKLLLKRFPYGIVYEIRVDMVVIVAIAHNSRDFGYWLERAEADE